MDNGKIISLLNEYLEKAIPLPRVYLSPVKFRNLSYRRWAVEELMSWIAKADEHLPWKEEPSWIDIFELFAAEMQNYSYYAKTRKQKRMWQIVLAELDVVRLYLWVS